MVISKYIPRSIRLFFTVFLLITILLQAYNALFTQGLFNTGGIIIIDAPPPSFAILVGVSMLFNFVILLEYFLYLVNGAKEKDE